MRRWGAGPLLALLLALGSTSFAHAATITVTTTSDSTTSSSCTLREAIQAANTDAAVGGCAAGSGADTIRFNIPGTGVKTISPTSPLPEITEQVTIDGYSQPGARANNLADASNAIILIELDGSQAGTASGLVLKDHDGSLIRGLAVGNFNANTVTAGVVVDGQGHVLTGNFIGTDAAGQVARRNAVGIQVGLDGQTFITVIGGEEPEDRNVISGNGIGLQISGSSTTATIVIGNLIGTTRTGTTGLGNQFQGIEIDTGARASIIGSSRAATRNVISGNGGDGIRIGSSTSADQTIQGNFIGTDVTGTVGLGNGQRGVAIGTVSQTTTNNLVGGANSGAGNVIAFNAQAGVIVPAGIGNQILSNRIFGNGGIGIDVSNAGVTPNDGDDSDLGGNNRQNFPVVTAASTRGSTTSIGGTLTSRANTRFRIELFASDACDASGHGEAERFVATQDVTTNGSGVASFLVSAPAIPPGQVITATATDTQSKDTSELSACKTVQPAGVAVSQVSGPTTEAGGTATFTVALTSVPAAGVTIPLSISDATDARVTPSSLTFQPNDQALAPRTVTVTGLDDPVVDGAVSYAVVLGAAQGDDLAYKDFDAPDVQLANQDNDAACAPRPQVTAQTAPDGPGRLRVTLTAATTPTAPNNRLIRIQLQSGTNAVVDAGGQTGLSGNASIPLDGRPAATTLVVRRVTAGQPVQQPFVVVDDCGNWPTFVGGGPTAF